jgi:hypothetical protein
MDNKHIETIRGLELKLKGINYKIKNNATKEHIEKEVIPDIERVARVAKSTANTIETQNGQTRQELQSLRKEMGKMKTKHDNLCNRLGLP